MELPRWGLGIDGFLLMLLTDLTGELSKRIHAHLYLYSDLSLFILL